MEFIGILEPTQYFSHGNLQKFVKKIELTSVQHGGMHEQTCRGSKW